MIDSNTNFNDGFTLLVDKKLDWTSFDVVKKIRNRFSRFPHTHLHLVTLKYCASPEVVYIALEHYRELDILSLLDMKGVI